MNHNLKLFLTTVLILINILCAQPGGTPPKSGPSGSAAGASKITLKGHVYSESTQKPVEYANIIIFSMRDSSQVTGNITDVNGFFSIKDVRPGRYFIDVQFMGYAKKRINRIMVRPGSSEFDLGNIYLTQTVLDMDKVEVEADRVSVAFQIDKKVINVGRQAVSTSGSAVDVLENIPSVTVDIDGNVALRGSENFSVLLDGRPTIIDAQDLLQQIPASKIENIEIITNPSAKFDPDGVAGILNIITKKNRLEGVSGVASLNGGLNDKYGGDIMVNYRNHKYSTFLSLDYNHKNYSGERISNRYTISGTDTSFIESEGEGSHFREPYSIRAGFEFYPTENDVIGISGDFGNRSHNRGSTMQYEQWTSGDSIHKEYISEDESTRGGDHYSANLDYQHKFTKKGHELTAQAIYGKRTGDETSINTLSDLDGNLTSSQKSTESGPSTRIRFKLDYIFPINETDKFEAGYQARFRDSEENNEVFEYDTSEYKYELQDEYSHFTTYKMNIQSLYTMYSLEVGKIGFQGGLRAEYTNRKIELDDDDNDYGVDRLDLFPSAHVSYQLNKKNQFMTSYTRRIDRPRGYYFEPFITRWDAYNVRQGNPDILPEYIDSYEASYLRYMGKNMFSVEGYYRVTNNKIERIHTTWADEPNVMLHTIANVGKDYVAGAEYMLRFNLTDWWNVNWMGNLYDYHIDGEYDSTLFDKSSFNWNMRLNSEFKLPTHTKIQVNGGYNSPTVTSQGTRGGMFTINLALRQDLMDRKMSVTLQARDIFGTGRFKSTTKTDDLYSYFEGTREAPMIMLNIRYNFNNYRDSKRQSGDNDYENNGEDSLF